MISASHNPTTTTASRLSTARARKWTNPSPDELKYLDGEYGRSPYATRENIGKTIDYYGGRNQYIGYLISMARNSYQGYKIGLTAPTAPPG